jgi:succinate dehydrogenase/fumarate reductase flavoprotein subunit
MEDRAPDAPTKDAGWKFGPSLKEADVTDQERSTRTIETEILVLGSGAAGCGAAIGAHERGCRVTLVDKGKLESSGCLGGGNDHFMAVLNRGPETDTEEAVIRFFHTPFSGHSRELVSRWVRAMAPILETLEETGVEFVRNPNGTFLRTVGFGQPGPWWIQIKNGQMVKRRLARRIRAMGIEVVDNVMITKLLTKDGRVVGAMGFHVLDGTIVLLRAKRVVMAMGFHCSRVMANSTGNPYNMWGPPQLTGSQCVLAYEAGAKLINLDLGQVATLLPKSFGCAGMNGINAVGAHELNAFGERFMGRYHPMAENGPRHLQILGTHKELTDGKGPPFFMDMRHCDPDEIRHLQDVLMPGDKATFLDYCAQRGLDFAKYPLEVELSEIALSGMLLTHDNFESTIKGLFNACVFQTFSGAMCGGYAAGIEAATDAQGTANALSPVGLEELRREEERIFRPTRIREGMGYQRFEQVIRQVMQYYMGFARNEQGIRACLDRLRFIRTYADKLQASNLRELMRTQESLHLLKMCELATRATLERRETGRTIYRRTDHPGLDDSYAKVLALWKEKGNPRLTWL